MWLIKLNIQCVSDGDNMDQQNNNNADIVTSDYIQIYMQSICFPFYIIYIYMANLYIYIYLYIYIKKRIN